MGGATGGSVTTQVGSCAKATQADPATRSGLPWLPTDGETETEPKDMYSQGDRLDPHKDRWEKAVGGAVSGTPQIILPWGPLVREPDCCDEGAVDRSRKYQYGGSRPIRLRQPAERAGTSATITQAAYGGTDEFCDPEDGYYSS